MEPVTVELLVGEDRHICIDLPVGFPSGPAEVTVRAKTSSKESAREQLRRQVQLKLRNAGMLNTVYVAPPDAEPLSPEERERITRLLGGSPNSSDHLEDDQEAN